MSLLNHLWERCMTLAPNEGVKISFAKLMSQEVEHGVINARILAGLGVDRVDQPIKQYLFDLPLDTFCDLAYFHGIGDRVGCYIGETWDQVPYEPLYKVAPKLHKDECSTPRSACATCGWCARPPMAWPRPTP